MVLWVLVACVLVNAAVGCVLVVALRQAARTVAAAVRERPDATEVKWTGEVLDDQTIGRLWAHKHPEEAAANNAGQLSYEEAHAAMGPGADPWRIDMEEFERTLDKGLDELMAEQAAVERKT